MSNKTDPYADLEEEFRPAKWLIEPPNRPPNDDTGVEHVDALYASVGRVLSAWELLENSLAMIFQSAVKGERNSAFAAYGSILGSGSRCDMLLAAVQFGYPSADTTKLKLLVQDVRRLAGARNQVAHGIVICKRRDGKAHTHDVRTNNVGIFVLIPPPYNIKKFNKNGGLTGPDYCYSITACHAILTEIHKLCSRATYFTNDGKILRYTRLEFS